MYARLSLNEHRLLHAVLRLTSRLLWVALSAVHSRYPRGHLLHVAGQEAADAVVAFRDRLEVEAYEQYPDERPYAKGDAEHHLPAEWPAEDVNRAIDSVLRGTARLTASPSELRTLQRAAKTAHVSRRQLQDAIDRGELPTVGAPLDIRVWNRDLFAWKRRRQTTDQQVGQGGLGHESHDSSSDRPGLGAALPTEATDDGPHYPVGDARRWHREL